MKFNLIKNILIVLCLSFSFSTFGYFAEVIYITDGDTCTVLTSHHQKIKIRLAGIDAPERSQPFGSKAKKALSDKVLGKIIEIQEQSQDHYGRTVANLYLDSRWINFEMVSEGWAWHYKQYSTNKQLSLAETTARFAQEGLWIDSSPNPPWEYRKGHQSVSGK